MPPEVPPKTAAEAATQIKADIETNHNGKAGYQHFLADYNALPQGEQMKLLLALRGDDMDILKLEHEKADISGHHAIKKSAGTADFTADATNAAEKALATQIAQSWVKDGHKLGAPTTLDEVNQTLASAGMTDKGDSAAASGPSKPFEVPPAPPAPKPTEKPIDYTDPSTENEARIVKRLYAPGSDDKSRPLIDELSHGGKFTRADCERWIHTHQATDPNYKTVAELDRNWDDPAVKGLYDKSAAATGKKVLGAITRQRTDSTTDISLASMAKAAGYSDADDMAAKNKN
jgi:hypothetical protein